MHFSLHLVAVGMALAIAAVGCSKPSFRARVAATGMKMFQPKPGLDIPKQRKSWESHAEGASLPKGTVVQPVSVSGVAGEWVVPEGAEAGRVMVYLHGGAFIMGSCTTHRAFVARVAKAAAMRAFAPAYRVAPEHPFPAALDDCVAAYRFVVASGVSRQSIALVGDSSGGNLALAMLLALKAKREELPAAAFCFSPVTDCAATGESVKTQAGEDPMITPDYLKWAISKYAPDHDPRDPLLSPLYGDLAGLPPVFLQVGSREVLLDDSVRFAAKAKAAGVEATVKVWPNLYHAFQQIEFVPESGPAVDEAAAFLRAKTGGKTRS